MNRIYRIKIAILITLIVVSLVAMCGSFVHDCGAMEDASLDNYPYYYGYYGEYR